jgi:hypothetical protein
MLLNLSDRQLFLPQGSCPGEQSGHCTRPSPTDDLSKLFRFLTSSSNKPDCLVMVSPFFRVEIIRFRASLSSRAGSPTERGDSFVFFTRVSCSSFSLEFLARLGALVTAEISHADRFFPPSLLHSTTPSFNAYLLSTGVSARTNEVLDTMRLYPDMLSKSLPHLPPSVQNSPSIPSNVSIS